MALSTSVTVTDGIDRGRRLVLGVVQRAAGGHHRRVVDRRDIDGVGLGNAVGGAVIGDDGDGARRRPTDSRWC